MSPETTRETILPEAANAEGRLEAQSVASFDLDHTKVRAPYVRLAGRYTGPLGDAVTKFDLRLVQPNRAELPTAALHTIEHLLAGYLRGALSGLEGVQLVDASPMGCRTGFYLTVLGEPAEGEVARALTRALTAVAEHEGEIPGCSERACGNYRDHSLPGARAWARSILEDDIRVQETVLLT